MLICDSQRTGMRILAYCLMPNHWHMVLWPKNREDLAAFVGWVSNTHVRRWREHRRSVGEGHLYQGRFKSFAAQAGKGLYEVLRYVEGNARRAKLVESAEAWAYGSLYAGPQQREDRVELAAWPVPRPRNWAARVNEPIAAAELNLLRLYLQRERPMVRRSGLPMRSGEWALNGRCVSVAGRRKPRRKKR